MKYKFDYDALMQQCEALYSTYPVNISKQLAYLDEMDKSQPYADIFTRKAFIYEVAAEHCEVKLFPACPLFAEIVTGRERNSVTGGSPPLPGIASWLMKSNPAFEEGFAKWRKPYTDSDFFNGVMFTDAAHHYADCETILKIGLDGVRENALVKQAMTKREEAFLNSIVTACNSVEKIAKNFVTTAEKLLETEQNEDYRENLMAIREAASHVPMKAASSFYEALCTIWITRELCNALEGFGFAVLGHIDRLLEPYYESDVKKGLIDRETAKNLIACFLAMTDARWDLTDIPGGTNASVIIGGCDAEGNMVYNEVTKMILEAMTEWPLANPKIQARISESHPDDYFKRLGVLAKKASNVLSVFNDDVVIQAHTKLGKKQADCNLYLAGGCQEIVIHNEVNCRAYIYLNLPQMLLAQIFPEGWKFLKEDNIILTPLLSSKDFEDFYARYLQNYSAMIQGLACRFNQFEGRWRDYNPCPLFSSTFESCVDKMMDVSEGGAVYNQSSFGMAGFGTLVDSLYAIKTIVYDEKRVTLSEFAEILQGNFGDDEVLRQYILNKLPKYGQDNSDIKKFAAKVMDDIPICMDHLANGHGGYYEASLFSFYSYSALRKNTGATPDGRLAGAALSRGINPSESTANIDAASLLYAQKSMDYTSIPGCAVLYMDLPLTKTETKGDIYSQLIRYFLHNDGGMMDFNIVDREQLLEAKKDPENHKNIIVRVCGYSAPFYSLNEEMQDEIINRMQR